MPQLSAPSSDALVKVLLIGDPGTGKTGALASLARAGYRVRILDMDNKVATGILPQVLRNEPEALARIDFISLRDPFKASPVGPIPVGQPKAFNQAMTSMEKWEDGSVPAQWGPETVFVLDSLTFLGTAAFDFFKAMNPQDAQGKGADPRQWYGAAQGAIEDFLGILTSAAFATNVVVISHITWVERHDGTTKGYASAIGKAIGPKIASYFDNVALAETTGSGPAVKRVVRFLPTALIDLKTPVISLPPAPLPAESALATFFEKARGK